MYSVQVFQLYSAGEIGWSAFTPFYPEAEPKDFFGHTNAERINHQQIFTSKKLKEALQTKKKRYQREIWMYIKEWRVSEMISMRVNIKDFFLTF